MGKSPVSRRDLAVMAVMVVITFALLCSPSLARPLVRNSMLVSQKESSNHLLLPEENVVVTDVDKDRVMPCDEASHHRPRMVRGRYGALVLNVLPKGTTPPSGPSKGTNNLNN